MASTEEMQAQLEEAMQTAELYAEQLAEKDDELAELRDRNKQLEDELQGEGRGGDLELRDELRMLRDRLEKSEEQLERSMDATKEQESRARELSLQNKALKMDKLKMEAELQKEQERAEVLEENLHSLRQRTEEATASAGRTGEREKTHKKTLIKALSENEELRREVADLGRVVETLYEAVNEKDAVTKEMEDQLKATAQELQDTESEVEELKRVIKDKDQQIAAAHEEIHAVGELEIEIEEQVKSKVEKWKGKLKVLQQELDEERSKQAQLQKKCDSLLMESGLREVEQQLVASEGKNKITLQELQQSRALLERAQEEVFQLARDNEAMRADQGRFIEVALEKEKAEIERLKNTLKNKDSVIEEERARYKELYEEKGSLEEELQDRDFTLAEYERGHGLTEAVLKQKKLKGDIKRRDKEIRRLNQQLSERVGAHEKLFEACRRLKKKAGLPDAFEFDDLELQEGMRGQTERLQGLIRELEAQNEALENERLRLLDALRKNAQNLGDKGLKFFGLSGEQVVLVNQFAENLRDGRTALPLNDKSLELQAEVKDLKSQLRDLQRDLAAAELQIEKGGGARPGSPFEAEVAIQARQAQLTPGGTSKGLEKQFERMAQEQASMVSEIKLELQKTLSSVIGMQQPGAGRLSPGQPSSPKQDPKYDKLMDMLSSKLDGTGNTAMNREQVESMRNELERQSVMNQQLVERLQHAEQLVQQLSEQPVTPRFASSAYVTAASGGGGGGGGGNDASRAAMPTAMVGMAPGMHFIQPAQHLSDISTRVGRQVQEQQIAALRLPPEEWTESYILLHNRLMICIERFVGKEKEVSRLERTLREYENEASTMSGQMAVLYREYVQSRASWEEETKALRKEADEARAERDALRTKARRLDTLCAVLEGDEDAVRSHVKELTRKVAVLEVNEVVLARKYNLIAEEERATRQNKEMLQHELVQAETALRERVLYLEEWKSGAQSQLTSMSRRLDLCVPRELHECSVRKLAEVKHKYRELLSREAQLRSRSGGAQSLRRRVRELEAELELARMDANQAKQEAATAREQAEWSAERSGSAGAAPEPTADAPAAEKVSELIAQAARFKGEALEAKIVLESAQKRAEVHERRTAELTREVQQESERADQAEISLESLRQMSLKLEQELVEVRDQYQGGANAEQRKILDERVEELEKMCEALTRENRRYRELADIASSQVQALETAQQGREQELESMRTSLREANSRSDDDAIIGKIQHELTTTKVSYQMFVRKYERAKVAIRRNELELHKLEAALDEKDRMIRQTREQARARILALEAALEELGSPAGVGELGVAPHSTFALLGMEKLSETIGRLGEAAEQSEEALRRSEAARRVLELELEEKNLEISASHALLADLRQKVFAEATGEDHSASLQDQRSLAQRLLELSEELKAAKLDTLRQRRELQVVIEEKEHVEKLRRRDEEHMQRLEETIANTESALRRREDDRVLRTAADPSARDGLGLPLLAVRRAAPGADPARTKEAAPGSPSEGEGGGPGLDEDAVIRNSELVSELQGQVRDADRREEQLVRKLEQKSSHIRYLRKRLRAEGIDDDLVAEEGYETGSGNDDEQAPRRRPGPTAGPSSGGASKYYEADARKLQTAAQQTIASLKEMVERKNRVIDGLKQKIELTRSSYLAERERDQAEIERLTEKLYEDNKTAIDKLRTAYEDIGNGAVPDGNGGHGGPDHAVHRDLMERLDEADVMIERKDRRILELEGVLEEMQILRQQAEDRAGQSAQVAEKLRDKVRKLAVHSEAQGQEQLVKQLRAQVIAKDKKLGGLRAAVVALKNEFVKSEEEHEHELIKRDRQIASIRDGPASAEDGDSRSELGGMREQLEALRERVERTREDLDRTKRKEEKLRDENAKLRRQLDAQVESEEGRAEDLSRTSADVRKYQRQVDELKRENRRLRETVANATAAATPAAPRSGVEHVSGGRRLGGSKRGKRGRADENGGGDDDESKRGEQGASTSSSDESDGGRPKRGREDALRAEIAALEKKLRVCQAQNAALRSAMQESGSGGGAQGKADAKGPVSKWEADKRLERRVAGLGKKLEERTRELEAARAQSDQAKALVEKLRKEKTAFQDRLARTSGDRAPFRSMDNHGAGGGSGRPREKEDWHAVRSELREVEARLADSERVAKDLRRVAEVEQRSEINRLKQAAAAARSEAEELRDELAALRARRASGGRDSLQAAEDQFVREDELRQQLAQARKGLREAEAELLERDNAVLELRFELEQESERASQMERSIGGGSGGEGKRGEASGLVASSPIGRQGLRKPGERFKRERDLENVVESLKKVVTKLQGENDRLKRSGGGSARMLELQKQVKSLRAAKDELELTNEALSRRLQSSADASAKLVRLEDALRAARRQLKERDAALEKERAAVRRATEEKSRVTEELEHASLRAGRGSRGADEDVARLRRRLEEQEALIESLERGGAGGGRGDSEVARLQQENERLLNELNAFDLDFFEEIEDLKYKYQRAVEENRELKERLRA